VAIAILSLGIVKAERAGATSDTSNVNLQKVMALVREKLEIQKRLEVRLTELKEQYPNDRDASFRPSDLASARAIGEARKRAHQYSSMMKDLVSVHRRYSEEWAARALQAQLPEPYQSHINARISASQLEMSKRAAEWLETERQNVLSISHMLNFANRNNAKIRMEHGQLVFADGPLKSEYDRLLERLEASERRTNEAGRALLYADDGTTELLRGAIVEYRKQLDVGR
jgi:hypothetical protein